MTLRSLEEARMGNKHMLLGASFLMATSLFLVGCSDKEEAPVAQAEEKVIPVEVAPVTFGVLTDSNQLTGTIEAENEVEIVPKASGEITNIYVKKGAMVKKGDLIAQLDDTTEKNAVQQQQTSLEQAKVSLKTAQNAKSRAESNLKQAKASLQSAKDSLEIARQSQGDNIKNIDIQIDNAQTSWETANKNLTRMKSLYDAGLISLQDYEGAVSNEKAAKNTLEQAKQSKEQAERATNLQGQESAVTQAEINVEIAEASLSDAEVGMTTAEISVEQAQLALESAQDRLDDKVVKATISGEVTDIVGEVGGMASSANALATIVATDVVKLNINISSNLLQSFKVGNEVDVKVAGLEDDFKGTVAYVSAISTGYGLFTVEVEVDNTDKLIRPGMVGSVIIEEVKEDNSLIIPTKAITTKESKSVIFIVSDGKVVMKEVEVGESSAEYTAVKGELKENDQVVVSGQSLLEDGNLVEIMEEE